MSSIRSSQVLTVGESSESLLKFWSNRFFQTPIITPASFSDLVIWAHSSNIDESGGFCNTMYDLVGVNNFTVADTSKRPSVINAATSGLLKSALRFDGSNDSLKTLGSISFTSLPVTTCVLCRPRFNNFWQNIHSARNIGDRYRLGRYGGGSTLNLHNGTQVDTSVAWATDTWYFYVVVWNGASTQLWVNGAGSGTFNTGTNFVDGFTIGAKASNSGLNDTTENARVDIADFFAYSRALTEEEIIQLDTEYIEATYAYKT